MGGWGLRGIRGVGVFFFGGATYLEALVWWARGGFWVWCFWSVKKDSHQLGLRIASLWKDVLGPPLFFSDVFVWRPD